MHKDAPGCREEIRDAYSDLTLPVVDDFMSIIRKAVLQTSFDDVPESNGTHSEEGDTAEGIQLCVIVGLFRSD